MQDIQRKCILLAKRLQAQFSLRGSPIGYEEVFSETGLMPAIAKRADQLCSLCLGYGIGVNLVESPETLTGFIVTFDDVTPNVLRYLCIVDVLIELVNNSPVPDMVALDDLLLD